MNMNYRNGHSDVVRPREVGPRVAMYSHDTMGLGHMRRNLLLAQALTRSPVHATVLLIAGSSEVNLLRLPPGVDCLSLPALYKSCDGSYSARRLDMSLADLTRLRANTIRAAVNSFAPDVFIVDNVPRGAGGELVDTLRGLAHKPLVRCVLGLRDILDDADSVRRQWASEHNGDAIASYYDAVWIYGDPKICNPVTEYCWDEGIANRAHFAGYLDPSCRLDLLVDEEEANPTPPSDSFVVCMLGGGQDGFQLANAFMRADLPPSTNGLVLAGPCMPRAQLSKLRSLAAQLPGRVVWEFVPEADRLIRSAHRVVAMGGYNTICSVLSHRKSALIVPRNKPRCEQRLRAERFHQLGLIDMLPVESATPAAISAWLQGQPRRPADGGVDFGGLLRIPELLENVLATPRRLNATTAEEQLAHA